MELIIKILIGLIAFMHCYIMLFEMFAWETRGKKVFKSIPNDLFGPTKALAGNLGLYNGFLASGLIWTFFISNPEWNTNVSLFFLTCVSVAGVYGAITAEKKIFFIQTLPALITILLIMIK